MIKYIYIIFTIALVSCKPHTSIGKVDIEIDPDVSKKVLLTDLFSDIDVKEIKCSDSLFFGNIDFIKSYGSYIFLQDQFQTKSITVINTLNNNTYQLKKRGKGPGEYLNLDAFTFDEDNQLIYLYERGIGFNIYNFPDFKHIKRIRYNEYLMNIELLEEEMLILSEKNTKEGFYEGVQLLNIENLNQSSFNLPNHSATIELSYPNTITKNVDSLYYASAGYLNKIFMFSGKKVKEKYSISFGEYNIPEEYWIYDEANKFEEIFAIKECATWIHNFIDASNYISFCYIFNNPSNKHFVYHNLEKNISQNISEFVLDEKGNSIGMPIGTYKNKSVFLIYPEEISEILPNLLIENKLRNHLENCLENNNPALLLCEI
ncbi:6-bladed beta-propeller [Carboxylicivirga sp. N1Y90]|uniref:6-bladed beta-propeller n=1 Tax=Carboxylicivirga fragile TaxID=3417571 RepID=UPI003D328C61|nr:6-bladed beta-propeller [Marinilabiliaceae bacterium N1Y90]